MVEEGFGRKIVALFQGPLQNCIKRTFVDIQPGSFVRTYPIGDADGTDLYGSSLQAIPETLHEEGR